MKHPVAALLSFFLLASAGVADDAPGMPETLPASASLQDLLPDIDTAFRKFQEENHVVGLVWGVVLDGKLVHTGGSGVQNLDTNESVTPDSLFRIASMSKAFTALAILKLRDEGKLSLDDRAEQHVPELAGWAYPTDDSPRIRIRDLLSHTAGLVTDDPWGDRQQTLAEEDFTHMLLAGMPFSHAPQIQFEYSNTGYALLGRVITNVSGRPFDKYIMEEIMAPLGMSSTRYEVRDAPARHYAAGYRWENDTHVPEPVMGHGVYGAMAGVQTSVNDYARWVAFLLDAWPARDGADSGPAQRSTVRELTQGLNFPKVFTVDREAPDGPKKTAIAIAYGMGLSVRDDSDLGFAFSHGGGYPGYGSYMLLMPGRGLGVFAFGNRTYEVPAQPVTHAALALVRSSLVPERAFPVSEALAAAYQAAKDIYSAGELSPAAGLLAMNFLMDRSAENWARELAKLRDEVGRCTDPAPIKATGRLSGEFEWSCESGSIKGTLILAPTQPPGIQALRLTAQPAESVQ